jgi:tripartite-type tricarboxylate transporter receptor subunit TctC
MRKMMISYRPCAAIVAAVVLLAGLPALAPAQTQTWPDRPIRIVIAFSTGGSIDTLGRIIAQKLSEALGQNVVVENRPGGGANIGAVAASQAPPDGHTLHLAAQSLAVNVTLAPAKGFDPVTDFEPVILIATAQDVLLVPPASSFHSVKDLVDHARAHPGALNTGTMGPGTSSTLATILFGMAAGIRIQHIPYTTSAASQTDLMTGRLSFLIPALGGYLGHIQAGKVRPLAVSGRARAAQLPEVPTYQEVGLTLIEEASWYALFAPKGTPAPIVARLNAEVTRILASPDMKERELKMGFRLAGGPPARLAAFLKSEIAKWAELATSANLVTK